VAKYELTKKGCRPNGGIFSSEFEVYRRQEKGYRPMYVIYQISDSRQAKDRQTTVDD